MSVLRLKSKDNGVNWERLNYNSGFNRISFEPVDKFIAARAPSDFHPKVMQRLCVSTPFKSKDNGVNWERLNYNSGLNQ